MSGSGISWTICKSAPRSRQDNHASTPLLSLVFYRRDALPATQPTASKHPTHIYLSLICGVTANEMEEEFDEDEDTEAEESMKHDQLTAFLEQMELQYRKQ